MNSSSDCYGILLQYDKHQARMVLRKKCHDIIKGLEKIILSSTYINYVLIYKFLPHFSVKCIKQFIGVTEIDILFNILCSLLPNYILSFHFQDTKDLSMLLISMQNLHHYFNLRICLCLRATTGIY